MLKSVSWRMLLLTAVCAGWSDAALAANPRAACFVAAQIAADQESVPLHILTAVYMVETGGQGSPQNAGWPWSVNIAGAGHRFDTQEQAEDFANDALAAGKRSIDIGCFQINIRWHSRNFRSLTEMFDPNINASYAAHYLAELFKQHGDWKSAVGAYHSNDPERAETYVQKIEQKLVLMAQNTSEIPPIETIEPTRSNNFPLFLNAESASGGSTFPLLAPRQPLIVVR